MGGDPGRYAVTAESAEEATLVAALTERLTAVTGYTPGQLRSLTSALQDAAAATEVGDDVTPVVLGTWWWPYRLAVVVRALNAQAGQMLGWRARPRRTWTAYDSPAGSGGLTAAHTERAIDVNAASAAELAAVPGLGRVTARRIVGARPFRTVAGVREAAGLSAAAWELAAPAMVAGVDREPLAWAGPPPGVRELHAAVIAGRLVLPGQAGGQIVPASGTPQNTRTAAATATLVAVALEVASRRTRPPLWSPSPERLELGLRGVEARGLPEHPVSGVAPVRGSAYPRVLRALLTEASDVRIAMFFVSGSSAINDVLDALAACRARGGRVRCLLADSLPGDVRAAGDVNGPGLAALRRRKVDVRTWWPEVALHEKSVVVDGRHVLVGSHNWTAASFFRHDETTLYLDSPQLGVELAARFDRQWAMLHPEKRRRVIALAGLACLPRDVVARLATIDIRTEQELPPDRAALRGVARRTGIRVGDLGFAQDVGRLMRELRVAEVTAACLVGAGLTTLAEVTAATTENLRRAIARPRGLPDALARRPVDPRVVDDLPGRR